VTVRLGISTYAFTWSVGVPGYPAPSQPWTVFDVLARAHDLGIRVVQIADNIPLHAMPDEERARLKADAEARGIALEIGTRGIRTPHLRTYLALAAYFASPILRVVMDTDDHHPSIAEAADLIRGVMPEFEAAGITLAVENHDRFRAHELIDLMERIDHPRVGICLDTVNSFGALEGPEVVVAALGPYVVNLHAKEFVVQRAPHKMGFSVFGAPAGQGMMNLPWLLDTLSRYGRDYSTIIESWPAPEATVDESAAKEQRWAQESTTYLRTLIKD
jgi:3-oxoisoapionate decarboxylase